MELSILLLVNLLLTAMAIVLILFGKNKKGDDSTILYNKINEIQNTLSKTESSVKEDFRLNREESASIAKTNREEISKAITDFRVEITGAVKNMSEQNTKALEKIEKQVESVKFADCNGR